MSEKKNEKSLNEIPEFFSAPLAGINFPHAVNGVDVSGDVGRSGKRLSANVALVIRVLVFRLRVDCQSGL
jgi:hypothetical protein